MIYAWLSFNDQSGANINGIPHSRPLIGEEEALRAGEVIASGHIAQGEAVRRFENDFCSMMDIGLAAAVSSGTAALHLALLSLDVGEGDEVIIPGFVCSALLHAVRYTGAVPVVADIDPETFNIDPAEVAKRKTARTRAVIVPHLFGLPADLDRISASGLPVIEDCAQAAGATYGGRPVGGFGLAAVYSFYATKVMTTGEGGMVASNSEAVIERVRDLREYDRKADGKTRFNYKMTDIQAAVGAVQLSRLEGFIKRRRQIAQRYRIAFSELNFAQPASDSGHIYFRYPLGLSDSSDAVHFIDKMRARGVICERPVYRPLHHYLKLGGYPHTEKAWQRLVSIPIYPALSDPKTERVIETVIEVHGELYG